MVAQSSTNIFENYKAAALYWAPLFLFGIVIVCSLISFFMRNIRAYMLIGLLTLCCIGIVGCRKSESPKQDSKNPKPDYTHLNGTWMGIGYSDIQNRPVKPDDFYSLDVSILNDTAILVDNDTLFYSSLSSKGNIVVFYSDDKSSQWKEKLAYDVSNETIIYERDYTYRIHYSLFTSRYHPNPNVKDHISKIVGAKVLTGILYDSLPGPDTIIHGMSTVNANITLTAVDDSTLNIDRDFLEIGDNMLHYKSTDYAAKTIIFQNFHSYSYLISTLTYNFETNAILFEQQRKDYKRWAHLKLQ